MARARTMLSLSGVLCLALVLTSCNGDGNQCNTVNPSDGNLPLLSATDAINLAKQAAVKLPSPPNTYNTCASTKDNICPAVYEEWPATPGTKVDSCTVGYDIQNTSCRISVITYTTSLTLGQQHGDQSVTFSSEWARIGMANGYHSWQFYVGNDSKVQFLCEQGDPLPKRPE